MSIIASLPFWLLLIIRTLIILSLTVTISHTAEPLWCHFVSILQNSELNRMFPPISDVGAFLDIVHNITKMAELKVEVNDLVKDIGENSSVQLTAANIVLDQAIDHACIWVNTVLRTPYTLKIIRLMFICFVCCLVINYLVYRFTTCIRHTVQESFGQCIVCNMCAFMSGILRD